MAPDCNQLWTSDGGGEGDSVVGRLMSPNLFFLARCCLGQVPGGAPFSQRSELATACTNRMQIKN